MDLQFDALPYKRPDIEAVKTEFATLLKLFTSATSAEEQKHCIEKINALRSTVETMFVLATTRYSINIEDPTYVVENDFADEHRPMYEHLISQYYQALVGSAYKDELIKTFGGQLFASAETFLKTQSDDVIELLKQENKLASAYRTLRASAKIDFDGRVLNLAQMQPYLESTDRNVRKDASDAYWGFFAENLDQFDKIYDDLVHIRHDIALKLGFNNFIELAYARLGRTDYGAVEVAGYREQVKNDLVPYVNTLVERKRERLGYDKLFYYDEKIVFQSGNATPKGDPDFIINAAAKMYRDLSPETDEFFSFLVDHKLMDLLSKEGKAGGGFSTFLFDYKAPFIYSNFNGTAGDVDVLTHEAGHAFQLYQSRNAIVPEYNWATLDASEIHSMSMEFFAWPYMDTFFEDEEAKYKFAHLNDAVSFIPYGVTVDEFQHFVYENPDATPAERRAKWREIEKIYTPNKDYGDNEILNEGALWLRQMHIFSHPFYYIDYTLAQVCALQFWHRSRTEPDSAWADYLKLCQAGGSKSFVELVTYAGLTNPFEAGTIAKTLEPVIEYLDDVDDAAL